MKKPLHKHIGHHAKRIHGHFTKYLYERDTIFATIWVFLFIVILGSIPLNLGFINPIKLGLKDFDSNDMVYSKLGKGAHTVIDTNIIIINIGHADREGIALMIEKTATYQPKVMALDAVFDAPKDSAEAYQDTLLRNAFKKHKNLVVAVKYQLDSAEKLIVTRNVFKDDANQYGYVNFPNEETETTRYFFPVKKTHDTTFSFFSSAILKFYDTAAYKKLIKKGDTKVIINYSRHTDRYFKISEQQLMTDDFDSSRIKGKIALLAYTSKDEFDIEDKKFTPMNEKFAGKSHPDMNGIVVHANIISMALENKYVKKLPLWTNLLIAVFVCWLHMSFFVRYYLESHIWFHLVAKIAQVASAIFFMWLGVYVYDKYRIKVDLKMSLIVIVMAVDVIYFYEAWAVWMHKKFGYKTVFKPHHH
jgi:CHASE2 domain-containing sensor protein